MNGLVQQWDWIIGLICLPILAAVGVALPVRVLQNKESPHPFSEVEMKRFNVAEKMNKLDTSTND